MATLPTGTRIPRGTRVAHRAAAPATSAGTGNS